MARRARGPFFVAARGWREPPPARGVDRAIPEDRQEVLGRIVDRLDSTGAYLHRYSNGEFVSSSLAYSFEECAKVDTLEVPGPTIHRDPVLGIFWRRGGCSD